MPPSAKHRIACFFATSGHSGVDRIVQNLLPGLVDAGHQVDLLKIRRHGPELTDPPPGLRIIELNASHVYSALPSLIRYLRKTRPDVLLSDKDRVNRTAILASMLARAGNRQLVRIGTTVSHNLASRGPLERWLQRTSMRYLYRYPAAVLMPSQGAADDFADHIGFSRRRIRVVPSPVVTPVFIGQSREPLDHPWFQQDAPPVILGVGELSRRKDFATLLRAFALLPDTLDCRLMILGRGRERGSLERLAAELGIADRLALPGFVANPYPYIRRAGLLAMTSRWEGLGLVLVEALALGTPVVATDCPSGPAEILQQGRYGTLVPVGEERKLAEAIQRRLQQPPSEALMAQATAPYTLTGSVDAYLSAMGLERST